MRTICVCTPQGISAGLMKGNGEGQSPTEVKDVKMITADLEYSY